MRPCALTTQHENTRQQLVKFQLFTMRCSPPLATLANMLMTTQIFAFSWNFYLFESTCVSTSVSPQNKLLSNRYPGHTATIICKSSQSRSDIVIHSGALDTFVQREACVVKPRPLGDDWTDQCKLC